MIPWPVEGKLHFGHIKLAQSLPDRSALSRLTGAHDYLHELSGFAKTLNYRGYVISFEHGLAPSFAHPLFFA